MGNGLRDLRMEIGCTQEEMATMLGVTKATISRYEGDESQKPQGDTAKKLEQLKTLLDNPDDRYPLLSMYSKGGAAAIAGLLQIGVSSGVRGASMLTLLSLPAMGVVAAAAAPIIGLGVGSVVAASSLGIGKMLKSFWDSNEEGK